jgi:hypothetical protein
MSYHFSGVKVTIRVFVSIELYVTMDRWVGMANRLYSGQVRNRVRFQARV